MDVNFKHNTKHITVLSFSILLTKCVPLNAEKLGVVYSYIFGKTPCQCPQNVPIRRPYGDVIGTYPGHQF